MTQRIRSQALPPEVLAATQYVVLPGGRDMSRAGTKRAARWDTILKYSGHPDGVALAHLEAAVSKRQLSFLARRGQIELLPEGIRNSPGGDTPMAHLCQIRPSFSKTKNRLSLKVEKAT